jgi:hypothetical protein
MIEKTRRRRKLLAFLVLGLVDAILFGLALAAWEMVYANILQDDLYAAGAFLVGSLLTLGVVLFAGVGLWTLHGMLRTLRET